MSTPDTDDFVHRLRELDLRVALEGIDESTYLGLHEDLVSDEICRLAASDKKLLPFVDLMILAALPSEVGTPSTDWLREQVDAFLFGAAGCDEFLEQLKLARIHAEKLVTSVAFGILCCDEESAISFAEFIPVGDSVPVSKTVTKHFTVSDEGQPLARIPLAYRVPEETGPKRLHGVEFILPRGVTPRDDLTVTLEPKRNRIRVRLARVSAACWQIEATLEFQDAPLGFSRRNQAPASPLVETLRSLVSRCVEILAEGSPTLSPELRKEIKAHVRAACHVIRADDPQELRHAYGHLVDLLRAVGPAAQGFFAYKFVEGLRNKVSTSSKLDVEFAKAVELKSSLFDAAMRNDHSKVQAMADDLSQLAWDVAMFSEQVVNHISDEMMAYLGITPATMQTIQNQAILTVVPELVKLLKEAIPGGLMHEGIVWLWLAFLSIGDLARLFDTLEKLPLARHLDESVLARIRQHIAEITGTEDATARSGAYLKLARVLRDSGPLARSLVAYVVTQQSGGDDVGDSEVANREAGDLLAELEGAIRRNDQPLQERIVTNLWALATASASFPPRATLGATASVFRPTFSQVIELASEFWGMPPGEVKNLLAMAVSKAIEGWQKSMVHPQNGNSRLNQEKLHWFPVHMMTPDELEESAKVFFQLDVVAGLKKEFLGKLKKGFQDIADVAGVQQWKVLQAHFLTNGIVGALSLATGGEVLAKPEVAGAEADLAEQRYLLRQVKPRPDRPAPLSI